MLEAIPPCILEYEFLSSSLETLAVSKTLSSSSGADGGSRSTCGSCGWSAPAWRVRTQADGQGGRAWRAGPAPCACLLCPLDRSLVFLLFRFVFPKVR